MSASVVAEDVVVERSVVIAMRDGVGLYADVWRPAGEGTFPVLVSRTPYGRAMLQNRLMNPPPEALVRDGFAVVFQDSRGRFESEGQWAPVEVEVDDGYDTVEWAAAQPWSNGKVGMFGASYMGYTQWLAAIARPPHLVAIAPEVASSDYYASWFGSGGALRFVHRVGWSLAVGAEQARRDGRPEKALDEMLDIDARMAAAAAGPEAVAALGARAAATVAPILHDRPLRDNALLARIAPWFRQNLAREQPDHPYWLRYNPSAHWSTLDIPGLHIGGWYDIHVNGTVDNFVGMSKFAATERARRSQRLVVGPWPHWSYQFPLVGEIDFGADAVLDIEALRKDWFGHWLADRPSRLVDGAPVRLFVMGDNVWRDEQEWPLARAVSTSWFLHSGGDANTSSGSGTLDARRPGTEPPDTFTYDPNHPVPTRGGRLLGIGGAPAGAFDQREIETRADVLVYTSSPLRERTEITGSVLVELWAATSAPDTDFTAKLCEVHADGRVINLCDGIVRARAFHPTPLVAGAVYRFAIDLWEVSVALPAGHCLRLEVSSSNSPHFEPNPNSAKPVGTDTHDDVRVASQAVFHDELHPSRLILPVIPRP